MFRSVVVIEDLPELAVELDGDALLQFTGADHADGAPGSDGRRVEDDGTRIPARSVVVDGVRS
jgi:hypothetical protein